MGDARRDQRRVLQAALVAAVLSGGPSTTWALARRGPRAAAVAGLEATRAVGVLVPWPPPARPGLVRGTLAHLAVSIAVGQLLGATLPRGRSPAWGGLSGLAIGWLNLAVIAPRRYPELAGLPLGPQLADNAAFGVVFAAVADR